MPLTGIKLGPIASRVLSGTRWTDEYPAWAMYTDELERLLAFAYAQGRIDYFVARLDSKNVQRDEALDELRVAYFLQHNGFRIVQWEPAGLGNKVGEYLIRTPEGIDVFTELKSPGWESELSSTQIASGRAKQPKYRNLEGGAFANWEGMRRCIGSSKTYPKFASTQPNLLVIADDFYVNLHHSVMQIDVALYANHNRYGGETGYFTSAKFENLGGVAIFTAEGTDCGMVYKFRVFENKFALPSTHLPQSLLKLRENAEVCNT